MAALVALLVAISVLVAPVGQPSEWTVLFDGGSFTNWYRFLPSTGRDSDPLDVFKLENGLLHVLDLPESDQPQDFGYMATVRDYSNYHVRVRHRWGHKRFAPRALDKRDAGLLYHVVGPDLIWPRSVECQIQESDTGDIFLVNGTGATTTVDASWPEPRYLEGGVPHQQIDGRIIKSSTVDSLTDWNSVEVIVTGAQAVHIVNGAIVARVSGMNQPDALDPARRVPLEAGRILLQAEGAEVYYDRVEIKEFSDFVAPPPGAVVLFDGTSTARWEAADGSGPARWPIVDGALEVCPGCGDIRTVDQFGDFRLHVEFLVPATSPSLAEQERGNSGIYLQGRYEVQVLDSFGGELSGRNDAGAVYDLRDADVNAARPSGIWQSYDLTFRAARFVDGVKAEDARLTLVWNGSVVHRNVQLPGPTPGGAPETPEHGPIVLQDHGNPVQYRNVWLVSLS
jgi:hypothetical protein